MAVCLHLDFFLSSLKFCWRSFFGGSQGQVLGKFSWPVLLTLLLLCCLLYLDPSPYNKMYFRYDNRRPMESLAPKLHWGVCVSFSTFQARQAQAPNSCRKEMLTDGWYQKYRKIINDPTLSKWLYSHLEEFKLTFQFSIWFKAKLQKQRRKVGGHKRTQSFEISQAWRVQRELENPQVGAREKRRWTADTVTKELLIGTVAPGMLLCELNSRFFLRGV